VKPIEQFADGWRLSGGQAAMTLSRKTGCLTSLTIKGGKPFDIDTPWFTEMLAAIGQPKGKKVTVSH